MKPGFVTRAQMTKLARVWKQGEHVVVSGSTGSGKTTLGRALDQIRIEAGGHVVLFVGKLQSDSTLETDYAGWTRWKEWKDNPSPHDNRVLLWPDTSKGKTIDEKKAIQKAVFQKALDSLADKGKWTVDFDEGLYMCAPEFMGFASEIAMLHALGRSSKLTIITKMQRPSNVPLIIYGSASHAFIGQTREANDLKRLSELGGKHSAKELQAMISGQGKYDYLWVPVDPGWEPERVNFKR